MNDELMFDYLVGMGQMAPQREDLRRRQEMINALRGQAMQAPQGQMVGKHCVPPSFAQYASQLGQGYMAGQAQGQQRQAVEATSKEQRDLLNALRSKAQEERQRRLMANIRPFSGGLPGFLEITNTEDFE